MKKLMFKISLLILIPLIMTVSYTSAWFSSNAVSSENSFKAGTLAINAPGKVISNIKFQNMNPGEEIKEKEVKVSNTGSLDLKCRLHLKSNVSDAILNGKSPLNMSIAVSGNKMSDFTPVNDIGDINIGSIKSGESKTIDMSFKLPESAGNEYQGASANIDFIFEAVQENAPLVYEVNDKELIQNAINQASEGDIINIHKGTYNERLFINKSISLRGCGDNPGDVIISKKDSKEQNSIICIDGKSNTEVKISNLEIDGIDGSFANYGITADSTLNNLFIEDVVLKNNNAAIWVKSDVSNVRLVDCKIDNKSGNGNGFVQKSGTIANLEIERCNFSNCSYAILYNHKFISNNPIIEKCSFTNCTNDISN